MPCLLMHLLDPLVIIDALEIMSGLFARILASKLCGIASSLDDSAGGRAGRVARASVSPVVSLAANLTGGFCSS